MIIAAGGVLPIAR